MIYRTILYARNTTEYRNNAALASRVAKATVHSSESSGAAI